MTVIHIKHLTLTCITVQLEWLQELGRPSICSDTPKHCQELRWLQWQGQ